MLRIGHRGACGYEPENTLRSFNYAIQLGIDMVELDVHICRSGEIIVIHDSDVNRTTNGTGFVTDKTLDELRTLDAGMGERIPTLREVLDQINRRVKMNVELKGNGTAKPVFKLLTKYVKELNWSYNDFLISSFNRDELKEFKRLNSEFSIGVLNKSISSGFMKFVDSIDACAILLFYKSITSQLLSNNHNKSLKTIVWTVDDKDDIERMKSLGVDGIASNYPDRI